MIADLRRNILNAPMDQSPPAGPRIAVIGDIMLDVDVHCACTRICQEGPWPVYAIQRTQRRWGGAGNVAEMLAALGADTLLVGVVGACDNLSLPPSHATPGWRVAGATTTTKTRLWIDGRLVGPRVDQDNSWKSTPSDIRGFIESIRDFQPQALIVADHGKGVVTQELMRPLAGLNLPIYVDPIPSTPMVDGTICIGGQHEQPRAPHVPRGEIIKLGPLGLRWSIDHQSGAAPSRCRNLVDALGAGDQFIAALACARALGHNWPDAIATANQAAGLQCERPGCVPVTMDEIQAAQQQPAVVA